MIIDRTDLLISVQRGLSWNVFPSLRAVCVESTENLIYVGFYCDGEVTDVEIDHCEDALSDIIADFSYLVEDEGGMEFETPIIRIDYPDPIPLRGDWVYYRHEDPSVDFKSFDLHSLGVTSQTNRVKLFLSTIYGLLGNVFPSLRAVCAEESENLIYICFYYDGEITDRDAQLCKRSIDRVIECYIHLSDGDKSIVFETPMMRMDYPQKMPLRGSWRYYRYEKTPLR